MFGYHPVLGSLKSSRRLCDNLCPVRGLGDVAKDTHLGNSKMGFRGQVFCLPYLVFTQHSIISMLFVFFPNISMTKKKVLDWPKSSFIQGFHPILPKSLNELFGIQYLCYFLMIITSQDNNQKGLNISQIYSWAHRRWWEGWAWEMVTINQQCSQFGKSPPGL